MHLSPSRAQEFCVTSSLTLDNSGPVYMEVGGPQVGEVTRLGGVTRLSIWYLILIWSRLHDRWVDPPNVTSPTGGPPPPCKQALRAKILSNSWQQAKPFTPYAARTVIFQRENLSYSSRQAKWVYNHVARAFCSQVSLYWFILYRLSWASVL